MIDLYYWPTPNGWKISIALEEMGLDYTTRWVNIGRGDQFEPEFLAISPNNRMPAIVDHDPPDGGGPLSVFESGAILLYLADKTGKLMPQGLRNRNEVIEWHFWQAANLGPMAGQVHHFRNYAEQRIPYAIDRFVDEVSRLYAVLDERLEGREFLVDDYSIADIMSYCWVVPHKNQGQDLDQFPNVRRWLKTIWARPAVKKGFALGQEHRRSGPMDSEARKVLFGQSARTRRNRPPR